MNFIIKYGRRFIIILVIIAVFTAFASGFSQVWWYGILPSCIFMILAVTRIGKTRMLRDKYRTFDLKEFMEHKPYTIDDLQEIFNDEKDSGEFSLKGIVSGRAQADKPIISPVSQVDCIGYKLTIGLVKTGDNFDAIKKERKYKRLLFSESHIPAFSLTQGNRSIKVSADGLLNSKDSLANVRIWSSVKNLTHELQEKINTAISIQAISKTDYPGIMIIEEIITEDKEYTVYGICKKNNDELVIEGTNTIDDPNSLFITNMGTKEREQELKKIKSSIAANRMLIVGSFMIMVFLFVTGIISSLFVKEGMVYYTFTNKPYKIKFLVTDQYWEFGSGSSKLEKFFTDSTGGNFIAANSDKIEILTGEEKERNYLLGVDDWIRWTDGYWYIDFVGNLPEPKIIPKKSGKVFIKNKTSTDYSVYFIQQEKKVTADQEWSWDAYNGSDLEFGTRAIYYNTVNGKKNEYDVILSAGDLIRLEKNYYPVRNFIVGVSPELKYIENKDGVFWQLTLDDTSTLSHYAKIVVKNETPNPIQIQIIDYDKITKIRGGAVWDFDAGAGTEFKDGKYIIFTTDDNNDETIMAAEGMGIIFREKSYKSIWTGSIGQCPYAKFDSKLKRWNIYIE